MVRFAVTEPTILVQKQVNMTWPSYDQISEYFSQFKQN